MIDFSKQLTKYEFRYRVCNKCVMNCGDIDFCYNLHCVLLSSFMPIFNRIQIESFTVKNGDLLPLCCECVLRSECLVENYDNMCVANMEKQSKSNPGAGLSSAKTSNIFMSLWDSYYNDYDEVEPSCSISDKKMIALFSGDSP